MEEEARKILEAVPRINAHISDADDVITPKDIYSFAVLAKVAGWYSYEAEANPQTAKTGKYQTSLNGAAVQFTPTDGFKPEGF